MESPSLYAGKPEESNLFSLPSQRLWSAITLVYEYLRGNKKNEEKLQKAMLVKEQFGLNCLLIHLGWKAEGSFILSEEQGSVTAFWKTARATEDQISQSADLVDSSSLGFSLKN